MKPVITQEDKKLVGHLVKKKKRTGKHVHVYYNKKKNGKSAYLTGKFYSKKNDKYFTYRSSYELRFYHMLENTPSVIMYESEPLKIPYKDTDGKYRNYIPDAIVFCKDGSIKVCEIKPEAMLDNIIVKRKSQACQTFFRKLLGDKGVTYSYEFITEKILFPKQGDYQKFLKEYG